MISGYADETLSLFGLGAYSFIEVQQINYEKDSQILKALSHPIRLQMVDILLHDECCVTDVMNTLGISQSTSSQHLTILKTSGIVFPKNLGRKHVIL